LDARSIDPALEQNDGIARRLPAAEAAERNSRLDRERGMDVGSHESEQLAVMPRIVQHQHDPAPDLAVTPLQGQPT
jgi:hypothetical protein